jgi:hypothetical protein
LLQHGNIALGAVATVHIGRDKVKFFLCWIHYAPRLEDVYGSGGIDPHILNLSTRWRWLLSLTTRE